MYQLGALPFLASFDVSEGDPGKASGIASIDSSTLKDCQVTRTTKHVFVFEKSEESYALPSRLS